MIPAYDDNLGWQADALCSQTDPETFFPEKNGEHGQLAKAVCGLCPVAAQCLTDALLTERQSGMESWGVRGGLSARARRGMIRNLRGAVA